MSLLHGTTRFVPTDESWLDGSMTALNRQVAALPYMQTDIRVVAPSDAPLPRQTMHYGRFSGLLHMHGVEEPEEPLEEARVVGVADPEHGHGPEGRRILPVLGLLDVSLADAPTYSLGVADLAAMVQHQAADLVLHAA